MGRTHTHPHTAHRGESKEGMAKCSLGPRWLPAGWLTDLALSLTRSGRPPASTLKYARPEASQTPRWLALAGCVLVRGVGCGEERREGKTKIKVQKSDKLAWELG